MQVQSVLVDERLVLETLLKRCSSIDNMKFVWKLIGSGYIRGYITDIGISDVYDKLALLYGEPQARRAISRLVKVFEPLEVSGEIAQRAHGLDIEVEFSTAIQIACGLTFEIDGILTADPLNFCRSGLNGLEVFTPGWLVVNHLENSLKEKLEAVNRQAIYIGDCNRNIDFRRIKRNTHTASAWCLKELDVSCGNGKPKATVVMQTPSENTSQVTATGNGPIDAAYRAVKSFLDQSSVPDHCLIYTATQATTSDSQVSVVILLQSGDALFPGRGFDTDTVRAYVYAYIDAINYMLQCQF